MYVYFACVQTWLQTTDFKDIELMGPKPSCVKTAPGKVVAARLFMSRSFVYTYLPACLIPLSTPLTAFHF